MNQQLPKTKYQINDCVDLTAPTVQIVGIKFMSAGPEGPVNVFYDVFHDGQIQEGVPESAMSGINTQATFDAAAKFAQRKLDEAEKTRGRRTLEAVPRDKLGAAVNGSLTDQVFSGQETVGEGKPPIM